MGVRKRYRRIKRSLRAGFKLIRKGKKLIAQMEQLRKANRQAIQALIARHQQTEGHKVE